MEASSRGDGAQAYELIPSDTLPLLDLSRSLGGEFVKLLRFLIQCRLHRGVAVGVVPHHIHGVEQLLQNADAPLERLWFSQISLVAFCFGSGLVTIACVVPPAIGVVCALLGLVLSLPLTLLSIAFLRRDMVVLVLTTYDFWFYSLINMFGAWLLATGFPDARTCIAVAVWLGNCYTITVDANTRFICFLNTISIVVVAVNVVVVVAIETQVIDGWQSRIVRLRLRHEDSIGTTNLVSNVLTTMSILVARNAYRRHTELAEQRKINCPMLRCINYRCRVKLVAVDSQRRTQLDGFSQAQKIYYAPDGSQSASFPLTQMYYLRCQALFHSSHTFVRQRWAQSPHPWSRGKRVLFVGLGGAGLALTAAVFVLYPAPLGRLCGLLGLVSTIAFLAFTLGLFQRKLCRGIIVSFDYVFVSLQLSLGFLCTAMLFDWDGARCLALISIWLWLHWLLTIDSLSPLAKHRIGVPIKLLVVPVMGFFIAAQLVGALEVVWRDQWRLQDRVVVSLFGCVHLRLLPFFVSRLIMTFLWSLRILWRIIMSGDGDAIIPLGRVAFRYTTELQPNTPTLKDTAEAHRPLANPQSRGANAVPKTARIAPFATVQTKP